MVKIAQFGSWESPLTAETVATAGVSPRWVDVHDGVVWWAESRPTEEGRVALMREGPDRTPVEVLAAPWNVRNRVHEYGGRPWTVLGDTVVFTNWADQRIYAYDGSGDPRPLTPMPARGHGLRYGDLSPGPGGTSVLCVRETVTGDRPTDVARDLVEVPLDGTGPRTLGASHHFMSGPRLSPDGTRLAWIGWDHPNMPWDGAELCVAEIGQPHRVLAGGPRESVCQAEWESPDSLLVLTDPDGWWNLFRVGLDGAAVNLAPCEEELGGPMWVLGGRWFAPLGGGRHAVLRSDRLAILDEKTGTVTDVDTDLTAWSSDLLAVDGVVVAAAGGPQREVAVVRLDLGTGVETVVNGQPHESLDPAYLPVPEHRVFTSDDGRKIPAFVYLPRNPGFAGPPEAVPPLLVHVHGGPTGKVSDVLKRDIAYFTSRGFGVVAVNYGGSAGYGRAFRESLNEQWGVVDVHDCATVAATLAEEGVVDGTRLAVRGGSAGGWTAAASMTSVSTYACATIMFPILDLTGWTSEGGETHDFESRYIEGLVGTLPEHADRYADRSPSNHVDRLAGPVLLLQGLEDEVCPPEQADRFVASLDGTGLPHAYLTFEGEQHGFRRASTVIAALEAELSFYGQVFGFTPPGVPVLELKS
ncbi:S9 family peptidase [Actinophytocola algeriensis]|uniref:Acetyl esterase/lipase n=1 Tax=Actinophytocola algeriensis TaxID=1768010 RepID=A0A7W7VHS3_9PSEU|nr:prolyl oligopeptidase family serine peptidase [Actinophytocola algeriensis]MBB4910726.1 acetyl esterase/lipase [Actinophytocola algeriensis]MBE1473719.1 acetyl esterase/lipase [Actinophytocola algeriensis]